MKLLFILGLLEAQTEFSHFASRERLWKWTWQSFLCAAAAASIAATTQPWRREQPISYANVLFRGPSLVYRLLMRTKHYVYSTVFCY